MKIICARYDASCPHLAVEVIPDSAAQKSGKPFFIPPFAQSFRYRVAVAVRICRLGKNIAEKFAPRYYDEASLCLSIVASSLDGLKRDNAPWSEATAFDGSVITGEFMPIGECGLGDSSMSLLEDGVEVVRFTVCSSSDFDSLIAYASQFFTLKIGDILMIEQPMDMRNVVIDHRITAFIGGREAINVKFK